jgi:hypothetical protein
LSSSVIDPEDPSYGDVHIVPCIIDGDDYSFCGHQFSRDCHCRPTIKADLPTHLMVLHEERKPS